MTFIERFGHFLLRNRLNAGIVALLFALVPMVHIPFVGWLSIIIVAFVTLCKGALEGLFVLLWSAMPAIIMTFVSSNTFFFSQIVFGVLVVWFFALLLKSQFTWSQLLSVMVWLGVVLVLLAHLMVGDIYAWWAQKITEFVANYNSTFPKARITAQLSTPQLYYLTHVATGFFAATLALNALFNVLVARWWQASLFNPGGLRREFLNIRLNYRMLIGLLVVVILAVLRVAWAFDLMPLFLIAFFVAGFSLMNAWLMRFKNAWIWMLLFYVLLVLHFVIIGAAVMIVAIVDSVMDIRKRWIIKKS